MNRKFKAQNDELTFYNCIKAKFGENATIRLSSNMLLKHHIDANKEFRLFLKTSKFFEYDNLLDGKKVIKKITIITPDGVLESIISFNRSSNRKGGKGDPRFWIPALKKKGKQSDLLVFFYVGDELFVSDLEGWSTLEEFNRLLAFAIEHSFTGAKQEVIRLFQRVVNMGWIKSVSPLKPNDKDRGDTFERAMGGKPNSSHKADYKGIIEYKTKREKSKTADSCFNRIPDPDISPLPTTKDIILKYGKDEKNTAKYPGYKSLFDEVSIYKKDRFYLEVDEVNELLIMKHVTDGAICRWKFSTLKEKLEAKHPATLWVNYKEGMDDDGHIQFQYYSASLTRKADFVAFIQLIIDGKMKFCWRARVRPDGTGYDDHGNGFRYGPIYRKLIFGEPEKVEVKTPDEFVELTT